MKKILKMPVGSFSYGKSTKKTEKIYVYHFHHFGLRKELLSSIIY